MKRWQGQGLSEEGYSSSLLQHVNIRGRKNSLSLASSHKIGEKRGIVARNESGSKMVLVHSKITLHTNIGWILKKTDNIKCCDNGEML